MICSGTAGPWRWSRRSAIAGAWARTASWRWPPCGRERPPTGALALPVAGILGPPAAAKKKQRHLSINLLGDAGKCASRACARLACPYLIRSSPCRTRRLTNLGPRSALSAHCHGCGLGAPWSEGFEARVTALVAAVAAFGAATTGFPATDPRGPPRFRSRRRETAGSELTTAGTTVLGSTSPRDPGFPHYDPPSLANAFSPPPTLPPQSPSRFFGLGSWLGQFATLFFLRLISHSARSLPHVIARLDRALSMRPSFDVVSRGMGRMECLVNHHPCSSQPSHTRQRVVPPPPAARGRRRASCPRAVSRQRVPASAFERLPAGASPAMMRSGRGRARRRPLRERLRACDPARACCIPRGSPVPEEAPARNAVGSFPRPAGGSVCTKRVRAGGPALPAPDLPPRGHGRLRAVGRPAFPGYPAYEPSTRRCPLACPTGAGPAARPFPPARFAPLGHRPCLYATSPAGARGRASGDSGNSAPRSTEPAG